jgi:hypothetical protein
MYRQTDLTLFVIASSDTSGRGNLYKTFFIQRSAIVIMLLFFYLNTSIIKPMCF